MSIDRISASAGYLTTLQAASRGSVPQGFNLGGLPTQNKVLERWDDNSVKLALLTTYVPNDSNLSVEATEIGFPTHFQDLSSKSLKDLYGVWIYDINLGEYYYLLVPLEGTSDVWVDGPLMKEFRVEGVLKTWQSEVPHPFLTAVIDVRVYVDGGVELDVAIENILNIPAATDAEYQVCIFKNVEALFLNDYVWHPYLTRWFRTVEDNFVRSYVDSRTLSGFIIAGYIPEYNSNVSYHTGDPTTSNFDLLGIGDLHPYMYDHGGRREIAPYPDWTASYLVYQGLDQYEYILAHGRSAGSWPIHIKEVDGSLVTRVNRPNFWLDVPTNRGQDGPQGNMQALPECIPDIAHQPSLAYVPYLMTGKRCFLDEVIYWANYCILGTYANSGGVDGYIHANETRGVAWGLRNIVDCAASLPLGHRYKEYFTQIVYNNLGWCDGFAQSPTAYDVAWHGGNIPPEGYVGPITFRILWQHNYVAWAIYHANKLGYAGGEVWRDQIVDFQVGFSSSPWRDGSAPYRLPVSGNNEQTWYATYEEAYSFWGSTPFVGYYLIDARLMAVVGLDIGIAGSSEALNYLNSIPGGYEYVADRAGWALA
jgi:hypothetical protein